MTVEYRQLKTCADIDPSDFEDGNWYLLAWGMGDAINAVLFLESHSPVPYRILCPPRNFSAIKFILDKFVPHPKCKQVDIYPLQEGYPIPENDVIMSKHGFGPQQIGSAHNIGKLKVVHTATRTWHQIHDLESCGILDKINEYDNRNKTIATKTCILFPERGDNYQFEDYFWENIISKLKENGYRIFVNMTNKFDVYKKEKVFEGTEELQEREIEDLFNFVVSHKNLVTIGQRSGIFDFLKYFSCRKIIFYMDKEDPSVPDPSRALYDWCHFGDDTYKKNVIDIKLSQYNPDVLDLILP